MFGPGVASSITTFWKQAMTDSESLRRRSSGPHGSEAEELRAEIGELRLYVAALFRILIGHGVLTADEARSLVDHLNAEDADVDPEHRRCDPVTGAALPPEESPFAGLGGTNSD